MKRINLTFAVTALILASPALAGGMSEPAVEPAPVYVDPGVDWTGFYGGAQLGWGWANADGRSGGRNYSADDDGFIGGLHAGYRYDFGNWVAGGELDYDWADFAVNVDQSNIEGRIDSVWRAKLNLGFEAGDALIYGTGGWANIHTDGDLGDETNDGTFGGIGAAWQRSPSSIFSVEWLYHDFSDIGDVGADATLKTLTARWSRRF
jgi:outer membrane immunogenic protein